MEDRGAGGTALDAWLDRAWMLLVLASAPYFLFGNEADNDLWVHVLSGRRILDSGAVPRLDVLSYTAAGSAWVDHEWLAQCAFAWIFEHTGTTGLWLGKAGLGLATAAGLWAAIAGATRVAWIRGAVMVLSLAVVARGFAVRPQVFTYFGVAVLLAWLARDVDAASAGARRAGRWIAAAALAFLLWANTHGGFVVGLGILGLYAALPPWAGARWRLALLGAAALAGCVNPYGPGLYTYILDELVRAHPLTEWQPVSLAAEHGPFWVLLALVVATLPFATRARARPFWPALALVLGAMALRHQRHTPLFALAVAGLLAEGLDGASRRLQARAAIRLSRISLAILGVALVGLAATQLSLLCLRLRGDGFRVVYEASEYPVGAVRFLSAEGLRGNVALPIDWGAYVLWHASPAVAVSLDGRFATVYPPSVVDDNFAFFRGGSDATRLLDAYPTTLVLAPAGSVTPVRARPRWRLRYRDEVAELFQLDAQAETVSGEAPAGRLGFP
jgi:hypothetical protein